MSLWNISHTSYKSCWLASISLNIPSKLSQQYLFDRWLEQRCMNAPSHLLSILVSGYSFVDAGTLPWDKRGLVPSRREGSAQTSWGLDKVVAFGEQWSQDACLGYSALQDFQGISEKPWPFRDSVERTLLLLKRLHDSLLESVPVRFASELERVWWGGLENAVLHGNWECGF